MNIAQAGARAVNEGRTPLDSANAVATATTIATTRGWNRRTATGAPIATPVSAETQKGSSGLPPDGVSRAAKTHSITRSTAATPSTTRRSNERGHRLFGVRVTPSTVAAVRSPRVGPCAVIPRYDVGGFWRAAYRPG